MLDTKGTLGLDFTVGENQIVLRGPKEFEQLWLTMPFESEAMAKTRASVARFGSGCACSSLIAAESGNIPVVEDMTGVGLTGTIRHFMTPPNTDKLRFVEMAFIETKFYLPSDKVYVIGNYRPRKESEPFWTKFNGFYHINEIVETLVSSSRETGAFPPLDNWGSLGITMDLWNQIEGLFGKNSVVKKLTSLFHYLSEAGVPGWSPQT